ncbi:TraX family protein [Metapseudomonas resinovorans]|uniref:TraX family protein n=1 Tax=Metapseudomonas resinovorans TaxID=53412 RepID=UPI0009852C00|nr:TraX family protein [Pseudomonas resinovorans]
MRIPTHSTAVPDRDGSLDLIKWAAMLTMLMDHLRYLWSDAEWLFIVGRAAFPLFCLGIAANVARTRTGDLFNDGNVRYLGWLMVFSVLSELPYRLLSPLSSTLNVMPTLMLGLLLAWGVYHRDRTSVMLAIATLLITTVLHSRLMYGAVGVLLPAALLLAIKRPCWWWLLPSTVAVLANSRNRWLADSGLTLETVAILTTAFATPLWGLWLLRQRIALDIWPVRRWGYFFYPGHLVVLQVLRLAL